MGKQRTIEPTGEIVTVQKEPVAVANPMTMLQSLIESKADPAVLKAHYDLIKEWKDETARMAYNSAMIACQSEMPVVYKDSKNPHAKADFASIENIHVTCKPTWLKHGFALSFSEVEQADSADVICMRCDVQHKDGFVKSHFGRYPRDGQGAKGGGVMNALQGTVSAHSYAERDMTTLVFNIVIAGRDKDGVPPGAKITPDQLHEINCLIDAVRDAGKTHNHDTFLKIFGVDCLEDMPAANATPAIKMLKEKLK